MDYSYPLTSNFERYFSSQSLLKIRGKNILKGMQFDTGKIPHLKKIEEKVRPSL